MACWPANLVTAFFVALLSFDIYQKDFQNLPVHAMFGVAFVALFWIVCSLVDERVSGALLLVPAVFLSIFMFSIWFTGQSLKQQGCCMNCSGSDRPVKAILVRKEVKNCNPKPETKKPSLTVSSQCVPLSLNATPVV